MIARAVERYGIEHFGIGSDLCQDQPDSVVAWMRTGRWTRDADFGEGAAPGFPPMPEWFRDNRDFANVESGLRSIGMNDDDVRCGFGRQLVPVFQREFQFGDMMSSGPKTTGVPLRSPGQVMRLRRLGSLHQCRLSFMRILTRRMAREKLAVFEKRVRYRPKRCRKSRPFGQGDRRTHVFSRVICS